MSKTPAHYDKPVQPWDLQRCMESSGNCFVDARRTDAIEYCFRVKDDMLSDLRKATHCLEVAIEALEQEQDSSADSFEKLVEQHPTMGPAWREWRARSGAGDMQKLREFNHGLAQENWELRQVLAGKIHSPALITEVMRGNLTEEWAVEIERLRAELGELQAPSGSAVHSRAELEKHEDEIRSEFAAP